MSAERKSCEIRDGECDPSRVKLNGSVGDVDWQIPCVP